jgi:hypothetical protein
MQTRIVATFKKPEDGLAAVVAQITGGYSVVLRDTDVDMVLDSARIFGTEGAALCYARRLLGAQGGRWWIASEAVA